MKHFEIINSKIHTKETIIRKIGSWRFFDKKIVFTNGCFDILHRGHIDYLSKAADLGDVLIVGVNSDSSVKRLEKGVNRPIQDELSRTIILASLHFINAVIIFNEDTPYELIKHIQPDVIVKGGDWKIENIVGNDIVTTKGGEVKTIEFLEGYSTTLIEKKIQNHLS